MQRDQVFNGLSELQEFLLDLRNVDRVIYIPDTNTRENDVEHSYFLAMAAWYVAETCDLSFDHTKLLKYALVHDLPEAYAGDVSALASPDQRESKQRREAEAMEVIRARFSNSFSGMVEVLECYEAQDDEESRFVKALDKIVPQTMIIMNEGWEWFEEDITQDRLISNKLDTTSISEPALQICNALIEFLRTKPEYFPDDTDDTDDTPS